MEFIAINLDDFHKNQKDAGTTASMVFVEAENITEAKRFLEYDRPESPWAIIWKSIFDANIVTKVYEDKRKRRMYGKINSTRRINRR